MSYNIADNIKRIRELRNMTQEQLAEEAGVDRVTVARYESGKMSPSSRTIVKLADALRVTPNKLLGESESLDRQIRRGVSIPVIGRVPAGVPFTAIEDVLDWEEIAPEQAKKGEYFALKVKGDSMEPRIYDGDVLIVRKQSTAESGNVVIALVNGDDATVKRFKRLEHGIMLLPNNPAYEPMVFTDEDVQKLPVEIIGVVVECRQKYNV